MRRNLVVSGWVAAAVVAVGAGVGAVALAQGGTLAPPTEPMSQDQVLEELDGLESASPSPETATPASEPEPSSSATAAAEEVIATDGGTVIARCVGDDAELVSVAAAQGWRTIGVDAGPTATATFGFTDDDDDDDGLHYTVTCVEGVPTAALQSTDDD